jgi:hypothetical protein
VARCKISKMGSSVKKKKISTIVNKLVMQCYGCIQAPKLS